MTLVPHEKIAYRAARLLSHLGLAAALLEPARAV